MLRQLLLRHLVLWPEEMTISSLPEEPAGVDAEGLGERGRGRHGPPEDELPMPPPAGADHHDFGVAVVDF